MFVHATSGRQALFAEPDSEQLGIMVYIFEPRAVAHHELMAFVAEADELRVFGGFMEPFGSINQVRLRARAGRTPVGVVELTCDFDRALVDGKRADHDWLSAHGFQLDGECLRCDRVAVEDMGATRYVYLGARPELAGDWPPTERD
jgi:hypothetical protein